MSEGWRWIVAVVAIASAAPLLFLAEAIPAYVPSARLKTLAMVAPDSGHARSAIADALHRVPSGSRPRRWPFRQVTPAMLGMKALHLKSWQNDEGLIGETEIMCMDEQACRVTARALLRFGPARI